MAGDGLVVVDIDDYRETVNVSEAVQALPPTFTVQTPHGGEHKYYAVDDPVSNSKKAWGEIRAVNQYVVGPGSELNACDKDWHDCSEADDSTYTVAQNLPIASISVDQLPPTTNNDKTSADNQATEWDREPPDVDEDLIAYAETCLQEFQTDATQLAFDDLLDVLNGGTGSLRGLRHDDGTIDRDKADLEACWLLYGVMIHTGESSSRARDLVHSLYTHYCTETPYTKGGRRRKWLRDENYRQNRLTHAINGFDPNAWHRWRRRSTSDLSDAPRAYTGEYSEVTYDVVLAALDLLTGGLPPELIGPTYGLDMSNVDTDKSTTTTNCHKVSTQPTCGTSHSRNRPTKAEVIDLAQRIDPDRSEDTHEEVLKRLQNEHGQVKAARMDSTMWVYYPAHLQDPPDACYVKYKGEKYAPNSGGDN